MSSNIRTAVGNVVRGMAGQYRRHLRDYMRVPDRHLGKTIYGNVSGVNRNVTGYLARWKSQLRTSDLELVPEASEGMEGDPDEFTRRGYTSLGRPYDDDLMERIRERYEELIETEEYTKVMHRETPEGKVYRRGIKDPIENIPALKELLNDHVRNVIKQHYGSHFQVRVANVYRTWHIPEEIYRKTQMHAENWHTDGKSTDHTKLFVTLSDTTEADGPLHIVPKNDLKTVAKHTVPFDQAVDGKPGGAVDQLADPVTLTGERGTAMLANTTVCIHKAGNPDPGHTRDIIQFYMAPSHKPWPKDWDTSMMGNTHNGGVWRLYKY